MSKALERWKSGDKRLQVVVEGFSEERRKFVVTLFEQLGWGVSEKMLGYLLVKKILSNTYIIEQTPSDSLLHGNVPDVCYPATTVKELQEIVDYENSKKQGNIIVSESNKVKEAIERCFKDNNSYENLVETELYKLCSLLEEVGGDGKRILAKLDDTTTTAFLDTLFRNGITFCKKVK